MPVSVAQASIANVTFPSLGAGSHAIDIAYVPGEGDPHAAVERQFAHPRVQRSGFLQQRSVAVKAAGGFQRRGDPAVQAFCHCSSCRGWLSAPIHAAALWPATSVKVTKGADNLGLYKKTENSHRKFCQTCGAAVLVDHPEVIEADEQPMACALPPRFDPSLPPAVDEARGLRKAYERALERRGATSVGRVMTGDEVPAALGVLHDIANGADWTSAGMPGGNSVATCHDIRSYYEEAALELVDGPLPGGRAMEDWFFEQTEAGRTVLAARAAMRDAGVKFPIWFYMTPGQR